MAKNGDDFLSGLERKLWSLHHRLCIERQCYTFFKWQSCDARIGQRGLLQWFVPRDHPECYEIVVWLEHELEKERIEDWEAGHVTIPGTDVNILVLEFSGVDAYLDRHTTEVLTIQIVEKLKRDLTKGKPHGKET